MKMKMICLAATGSMRAAVCGVGALLCIVGCSHEQKPAAMPLPVGPPPVAVAQPSTPTQAFIVVSESLKKRCNLPDSPDAAPQFDFDETALRPRGENILVSLASCMTDGNMKGEGIVVVGHTDPRGSDDYNLDLGQRRAQVAADYLTSHGVQMAQILVQSRGKQDATGATPDGWQLDRNVQIAEREQSQAIR